MKIGVLTSSRADFSIYLPLLKELQKDAFFDLEIIAFGTHLSHFHGYTIRQIEEEGFTVNYTIESMLVSDSKEGIATAMSLTMMKFSTFWKEHYKNFDLVFCLGDRYEMFAAVMASVPFQVKFAHLHGGEKTLGAIDNVFRHALSHASMIHFTSTEQYKRRIEEMIDEPNHIYHVGALSLDNLLTIRLLSIEEFKAKWGIDLTVPTVLTTFHPETINVDLNIKYAEELSYSIIEASKKYQFIITMPNVDTSGNSIREIFKERFSGLKNVFLIENLGTQSYFTVMKHSNFLLGNTSSGIIEAASFGKYVINLGERQHGRACGNNVIQTDITSGAIDVSIAAIENTPEYLGGNIYYKAGATDAIINILKTGHE
ncbi:UDP-N-acetylglucosamine 2-epimerase [Pedobacter sp. P351]|uniref:UDP-N-acetylglucosamine 2-epimerase n=1 Tax=Pedobacter superstes TaxID=3133441 RepID=UPI00309CB13A